MRQTFKNLAKVIGTTEWIYLALLIVVLVLLAVV